MDDASARWHSAAENTTGGNACVQDARSSRCRCIQNEGANIPIGIETQSPILATVDGTIDPLVRSQIEDVAIGRIDNDDIDKLIYKTDGVKICGDCVAAACIARRVARAELYPTAAAISGFKQTRLHPPSFIDASAGADINDISIVWINCDSARPT